MSALTDLFLAIGNVLAEHDSKTEEQAAQIAEAVTDCNRLTAQDDEPAETVTDRHHLPEAPAAEEAAANTPAPAPKKKNKAHYTLTCQVCGTVFKATTRNGKYCLECRNREKAKNIAAAHARYREKAQAARAMADSYAPSHREEPDMVYGNSIDM